MNALKGWAKKWGWCDWHKPMRLRDDADGVAYEEDAERRLKRKQLQVYCADCHHWMWSHEWGDKKQTPARTYQFRWNPAAPSSVPQPAAWMLPKPPKLEKTIMRTQPMPLPLFDEN